MLEQLHMLRNDSNENLHNYVNIDKGAQSYMKRCLKM